MSGSCGFRGWIEQREGFRLLILSSRTLDWRRRRGRGVRIGAGKLLYSESGELVSEGSILSTHCWTVEGQVDVLRHHCQKSVAVLRWETFR